MPELFTYLIKVNIALVLFCLGYYLVLRKLTFYTLNRAYLLTAIIFSSMYPFIDLTVLAQQHQDVIAPVQNVVMYWKAPAQNLIKEASYWSWLEVLFWTGAAVFAARLLFQLASLYKIYSRSTIAEINGQTVRVVKGDITPFTFWQSIYVNPEKLNPTDLHNILQHEQIHVKDWHTLDVLITEISVIFYWFNPGIWLMKKAVHENIEFITDRKILQNGLNSKAYQYSLLNITFNQSAPAITSNFNFSTLKKRIMMMNANRSSKISLTRYAFLVPLVVVCLLTFSLSKAEVVKASPAFKAIAAAVNGIENATFAADTNRKTLQKGVIIFDKENKQGSSVNIRTYTIKNISDTVPRIRIRGGSGSDSVAYVVDGKVATQSVLNGLDPNNIESVSVIKDKGVEYLKKINLSSGNTNKLIDVIVVNTRTGIGATKSVVDRVMTNVVRIPLRLKGDSTQAPLVVIDGQLIIATEFEVSPDAIEYMTVLKSATAVSTYGEKAKNGAIIITTKKKQ